MNDANPFTPPPAAEPNARPAGLWPQRRQRRLLLALAVSVVAVLAGYMGILPVFRGDLQRYLGIDDPRFGLLFGLGPLVGAGAALAGGALVNRLGAVRLIRLALIGTAGGMLLVATAGHKYVLVLAGCVLCSACAGPLNLAIQVYLTRLFPRQRRRILSLNMAVVCGGGILLPLLAEGLLALPGRLPGVTFGQVLRWPLLAVATILALAALAYRSRRPPKPRSRAAAHTGLRQFLLPLPVAWLVVLLAVHGAFDTSIYVWMPKFLGGASFAAHPVAPGLVLSAYSLAYFVSRAILASLPEAWGRRTMLVLPGLLGGGLLLCGVLGRSFWLAAGGYVLGAFCWSAEFPTMMGVLAGRGRQRFGAALAVFQVLMGPTTAGLLYGAGRASAAMGEGEMWRIMAVLACGFLLVGAGGGVWLTLWGRDRTDHDSTA